MMKNRVKLDYYDAFRCSADKCHYTCCQEWAIAVDQETQDKWQGMTFEGQALCDCLKKDGSNQVISLEENKMCPFLSQDKLCKLVVELGVEYSTEICRRYPRHINKFPDREEYTLDFGCPAVIDLIHGREDGIGLMMEGEASAVMTPLEHVRLLILELMQDSDYTLPERMMVTGHILLELLEAELVDEALLDSYADKEGRDVLVAELREMEFDAADTFWERNELFQDMILLYTKSNAYGEYVEEISMWSQRLSEWYSDEEILAKNEVFEKQYVSFAKLFENYLIAELWASTLQASSTLEDMVRTFQWITLEYCAMRQGIFLKWLVSEEQPIHYDLVRDYIMIVSRMAGYDQSDLKNCLEFSFDQTLLEWGYLAVVLGNGRL
ncbi:MAG: flagellin lysine-N-methylase [Cellulosilyticaceae bacterium]